MFEKFGEMSSCREINELAENLLNEGDIQSLKVMAQENGIPEDYVEMYRSGDIPYLCDAVTAAMGKLDVECGSLKLAGLMNDWVEYIRGLCMEDEMVAHQVRKKGKSLKQCIGDLPDMKYKWKYDNSKAGSPYRLMRDAADKKEIWDFQEKTKDGTVTEFTAQFSVKRTGGGVNGVIEFEVTMAVQSEIKQTDPA